MKVNSRRLNVAILAVVSIWNVSCNSQMVNNRGSESATKKNTVTAEERKEQELSLSAYKFTDFESDHISPPHEYFTAVISELETNLKERSLGSEASDEEEQAPRVLWINFDGAKVERGFKKGKSFIVCSEEAEIPAAVLSDEEKLQIITNVQNYYNLAKVKLNVTATKPTSGSYTTIIVGGTKADLGCKEDETILGVAPLDWPNFNWNDIGFAFSGIVEENLEGRVEIMSITIAHEAGHTFGLEHIKNNKDVMAAVVHPGIVEGFSAGTVDGGLFTRHQDSPVLLRKYVGALAIDGEEPEDPEEEEDSDRTFKENVCHRIQKIQDYLFEKLAGRVSGSESIFDKPGMCEED